MKLALYKGNSKFLDRVTASWTMGKYSHCEMCFSDGVCASSSRIDGGVRFKTIDFKIGEWDFIELPGDESKVRAWFEEHEGDKYDHLGLLGFILRPISGKIGYWVCGEAIMEALGFSDSWRYCPNTIASIFGNKEYLNAIHR